MGVIGTLSYLSFRFHSLEKKNTKDFLKNYENYGSYISDRIDCFFLFSNYIYLAV